MADVKKRRLSSAVVPSRSRVAVQFTLPEGANAEADTAEAKLLKTSIEAQQMAKRKSLHFPKAATIASSALPVQSSAAEQTTAAAAPIDSSQLSALYSMCVKLATANKINQKNVWNLQLIDYLGDVIESESAEAGDGLEPQETMQKLNFQKASATLDASVMIYSSRVDCVHKDTYKILGGLSGHDVIDEEDEEQDDNDNENDQDEQQNEVGDQANADAAAIVKKRRPVKRGPSNTLETKVANLNVKTLESEFAVDPMFKKMLSIVDEGGAKGMLLNHLSVYNGLKIAFDSAELIGPVIEIGSSASSPAPLSRQQIDLSDLSTILRSVAPNFDELHICPTLTQFGALKADLEFGRPAALREFSSVPIHAATEADLNFLSQLAARRGGGVWKAPEPAAMEFDHSDDCDISFGADLNAVHAELDQAIEAEARIENRAKEMQERDNQEDDESESVASASSAAVSHVQSLPATGADDFLLEPSKKLWAGFAHWKFRAPEKAATNNQTTSNKAGKKRNKANLIDFSLPVPDRSVFEPIARKRGGDPTVLSQAAVQKQEQEAERLMLPEDINYKVRNLQRLFLKPTMIVRMKHRMSQSEAEHAVARLEFDTLNVAEPVKCERVSTGSSAEVAPESAPVFEYPAPAFDDDYDGGDADSLAFDGPEPSSDQLRSGSGRSELDSDPFSTASLLRDSEFPLLSNPGQRVEKIDLGFAKTAKRVDVKALKESMWKGMELEAHEGQAEALQSFQGAINSLPVNFPSAALESVSVSYCFICLLHLANEKNLELKPIEEGQDKENQPAEEDNRARTLRKKVTQSPAEEAAAVQKSFGDFRILQM